MTTSFSYTYEELFAFPTSLIKSPGGLLRKVKTEDTSPAYFSSYSTPSTLSPTSAGSSPSKTSKETLDERQNETSDSSVEIKSFFSLLKTDNAHKYIAKELSKLPQGFVDSLQLKIILTDNPNAINEKYSMKSTDFLDEKKFRERLYSIIFDSFLAQFPEAFSLWAELNSNGLAENLNPSEEMKEFLYIIREKEIERSFYAVMINKKYPKAFNILKFKELLSRLDPKGFSQQWFKNHNRDLKKEYKVRFNEEDDSLL